VIAVPDLDDGPRWATMVRGLFGDLDLFVTANPYVARLMEEHYRLVHPVELLDPSVRVKVDGSMVRRAMARGEPWQQLVPEGVASYITERGLDARFCREFGLQTLAADAEIGRAHVLMG
jgi:nicotinamide-nucleotide adenylyltransferase